MINKGIAIIGLAEIDSNWSKIPIKENIYNMMYRWFKTRRIRTGYNRFTTSDGPFKSGGTCIIVVDEVSCGDIAIRQELQNLGRWSWKLLRYMPGNTYNELLTIRPPLLDPLVFQSWFTGRHPITNIGNLYARWDGVLVWPWMIVSSNVSPQTIIRPSKSLIRCNYATSPSLPLW